MVPAFAGLTEGNLQFGEHRRAGGSLAIEDFNQIGILNVGQLSKFLKIMSKNPGDTLDSSRLVMIC